MCPCSHHSRWVKLRWPCPHWTHPRRCCRSCLCRSSRSHSPFRRRLRARRPSLRRGPTAQTSGRASSERLAQTLTRYPTKPLIDSRETRTRTRCLPTQTQRWCRNPARMPGPRPGCTRFERSTSPVHRWMCKCQVPKVVVARNVSSAASWVTPHAGHTGGVGRRPWAARPPSRTPSARHRV